MIASSGFVRMRRFIAFACGFIVARSYMPWLHGCTTGCALGTASMSFKPIDGHCGSMVAFWWQSASRFGHNWLPLSSTAPAVA